MAKEKKFKITEENKTLIQEFIKDFREPNKNISKNTIYADRLNLRKFADFLGTKSLKDATENDLKEFFKLNRDYGGYNLIAIKLNMFYRWLEKLPRKQIPKRMEWFEYEKVKDKDTKQIKEELITPKEYKLILENSGRDRFGMWEALWETLYQSGARVGEINSMKIKDVELKDGRCTIYVPESKTKTREIFFEDYPFLLERWLYNHPDKDNLDAPLWISNSTNHLGEKMVTTSITLKLWQINKKIGIKKKLSPHCFRKTRFTYMSNKRSKDGGLIYSDSQLALFFGWSFQTIAQRRRQYDLTSVDELRNTIFNQKDTSLDQYDIVKRQKQKLEEHYQKEIAELNKKYDDMNQMMLEMLKNK